MSVLKKSVIFAIVFATAVACFGISAKAGPGASTANECLSPGTPPATEQPATPPPPKVEIPTTVPMIWNGTYHKLILINLFAASLTNMTS